MDEKYTDSQQDILSTLCEEIRKNTSIDPAKYSRYDVKRGLRNADGSGVMVGLTRVSNVHGYVMSEGEKTAIDGELCYRGIQVTDMVENCVAEQRFGYEETAWLLLFGRLPKKEELDAFTELLSERRELPLYFAEDMIIKAPSPNIMNKMQRSVLALYSYDDDPDTLTLENVLRQSIDLMAMLPTIMGYAYQVKRRHYEHKSMYFHPTVKGLSTAETVLRTIRADKQYTPEEARLLDICLMLHAEHGGGNNSTFATRVLSSSGTDTYSAIAAAIGSLKGPRHGGANIKVLEMLDAMKEALHDPKDDEEVRDFLQKLLDKRAGDRSGLIYGMGHAVYTLSDPRARVLKRYAYDLAEKNGYGDDFRLLNKVEELAPELLCRRIGEKRAICANVDLYSGLVYRSLRIDPALFTPLFALARMAGWCAHRVEEITSCNRIIRPAYKALMNTQPFVPLSER